MVPFLELKRLLHELKDLRPDIFFRYRLMGEMWQPNYLRVLQLTDKGAVLVDETSRKVVLISDLSNVMQFEVDQSFRQYDAHTHYTVEPTLVY
ncbi:MAG TPA: hypothetical protein VF490_20060 [Chryseosolibacter sp.]